MQRKDKQIMVTTTTMMMMTKTMLIRMTMIMTMMALTLVAIFMTKMRRVGSSSCFTRGVMYWMQSWCDILNVSHSV